MSLNSLFFNVMPMGSSYPSISASKRHHCKAYILKQNSGSAKANGREPKGCLGRVFNF